MRGTRFIILTSLLSLGFAASAFAFEEPSVPPPGSRASAPILSGTTSETRYGPLSIEGGLTTNGPFNSRDIVTSGDLTITDNAQLCLSGVCVTHWDDILHQFVRLSPGDSDSGFIHLNGQATFQGAPNADFALFTRAIGATSARTYGFSGTSWGAADSDNLSFGVLGIASHDSGMTGQMAHGIFGWNGGNANAYAGYFEGRVDITDSSLLCFIDGGLVDCRDTWPLGGPADDLLMLQTYWPTEEQPAPGVPGWTAVNGPGRITNVVLGDPDGHSLALTCGDGVCTETPATCPTDCPEFTAIDAAWQSNTTALVTWTSNTPMTSIVQFGLSDQYGNQLTDTAALTSHSLLIEGIDKALTYHYRVGGVSAGSGAALISDDLVLPADIDTTPPSLPTNMNFVVHLPAVPSLPGDIETVNLTWVHAKDDLPASGGSGFKEFRIYRKLNSAPGNPPLIATTVNLFYNDRELTLDQAKTYQYRVTAVDNNNNESSPVSKVVHIPKRCTTNLQCTTDAGYPNCCNWGEGGKACAVSCAGAGI